MMSFLKDIVDGHTMAPEPEEPLAVPVLAPVEPPEGMPGLDPEPEPLPAVGGLTTQEQRTATGAQVVRKSRRKTVGGSREPIRSIASLAEAQRAQLRTV